MSKKIEQIRGGISLDSTENGRQAALRLDPPIASSNWVLVRGRVDLHRPGRPLDWLFGWRRSRTPVAISPVSLEVRLPDSDEPRELAIGSDGSFEARLAVHLPRLRAARRNIVFTLRYQGTRVEQPAPLFAPSPGAALGVIVLVPEDSNAGHDGHSVDMRTESAAGLSECSRELTVFLCSNGAGGEPNPVFYLGMSTGSRHLGGTHRESSWPEGLAIPLTEHGTASAEAVEQAAWIARLMQLFANELDFVIVADTSRHNVATLRALAPLDLPKHRLRAVFLSDTRPVARGVRLQAESPPGIDGLKLPIEVCRTLDDARRAAAACGLTPAGSSRASVEVHSHRRISVPHARGTRYPLVFCHGMLGYSVLKLHPVDLEHYFNGLRERLSERGFDVLMPQLGRTHSIEQRAEQLRQTIGRWTTEPVNIIGHSMGGLDARFLISKLGMADRVASLTTIATPHHGSYFADWFVERFDAKLPFLRGLEKLGLEVDGFHDCTRAASRVFNQTVLDSPKLRYFSYSAFQVARKIPPVLRRSHSLIARTEGANDGLVSELSAHWGEHVATIRADHGSLVGERGPEYFDHLAFYSRIVEDLIRLGF